MPDLKIPAKSREKKREKIDTYSFFVKNYCIFRHNVIPYSYILLYGGHYVKDKNIQLFNMDFQDFIEKVQPTSKDLVYLDPPYLITFSEYNKLWNEDSEIRLINYLDELNARGIRFAVSNVLWHRKRYNGTFNMWAQKYNIVKIKSNYISFNDNTEKDTYEVLVKNY